MKCTCARPFSGPGGKRQISNGGGQYSTWSRTRNELFYTNNRQFMVADYRVSGESFQVDKQRLWPPIQFRLRPRLRSYDLHPDGTRAALALPESSTSADQDHVTFVFNWFEDLRRIAPVKR